MSTRYQGVLKHPILMWCTLVIMRLCLAAYLAGRDDKTLLGPKGVMLRTCIERTHSATLILRCFIRHSDRLVGIGGQSIVMIGSGRATGQVCKYNYVLAGVDDEVLRSVVDKHSQEQSLMVEHFGDLVQPTTYVIAALPLRGPFARLQTLTANQPILHDISDIFNAETYQKFDVQDRWVQEDLTILAEKTKQWLHSDKWLDLVGPDNIVVTRDFGEPRVRIIDTGLYATEYLCDVNPVIGKAYREVILDRLKVMEGVISRFVPVLVVFGLMYLGHEVTEGFALWRSLDLFELAEEIFE